MGAKIENPRASNKTPKIPGPNINPQKTHAVFPSLKNFQKSLNDNALYFLWSYYIRWSTRLRYAGTTTNLQIVLNTQKNLYLNQPKKLLGSSPSLELRSSNPPPPHTHTHTPLGRYLVFGDLSGRGNPSHTNGTSISVYKAVYWNARLFPFELSSAGIKISIWINSADLN